MPDWLALGANTRWCPRLAARYSCTVLCVFSVSVVTTVVGLEKVVVVGSQGGRVSGTIKVLGRIQ